MYKICKVSVWKVNVILEFLNFFSKDTAHVTKDNAHVTIPGTYTLHLEISETTSQTNCSATTTLDKPIFFQMCLFFLKNFIETLLQFYKYGTRKINI